MLVFSAFIIVLSAVFNSSYSTPVINGVEVPAGRYRFMVYIEVITDLTGGRIASDFCCGIILDNKNVLTAAHCLPKNQKKVNIIITAGSVNKAEPTVIRRLQNTKNYVRHPQYDTKDRRNDLAIIKLPQDKFNFAREATIAPAILTNSPTKFGTAVTFVGWGITNLGRDENLLRSGSGITVRRSICGSNTDIGFLCMEMALNHHEVPCNKDSGSPLIDGNGNVVGIFSYNYERGGERCSAVVASQYTAVFSYLQWIKSNKAE